MVSIPQTKSCATQMRSGCSPASTASTRGFGLIEAIMSMGLIMLIALTTTQTFLVSNRNAATNRVLTAARTIVQRNLDMAMSQRFDGSTVPAILALTSGTVVDDDGGADNQVNILVQKTGSTQNILVKGTLTETVTAEPNPPQNADIRRVTFRLTYTFQRRTFVVDMTALRAIDD
jgi:type II secretory pathway pseudopilin PulG